MRRTADDDLVLRISPAVETPADRRPRPPPDAARTHTEQGLCMSGPSKKSPSPPPRWFILTFWVTGQRARMKQLGRENRELRRPCC